MAVPTTNLVLDLNAATGLTLDGSNRVSQWDDQSGAGNHCTQGTSGVRPYDYTDFQGNKAVMFPYDYPTHPGNYMTVPTSLSGIGTRSVSVYVVAASFHLRQSCMLNFTGFPSPWMSLSSVSNSPNRLGVSTRAGTTYVPVNKAVLASVGRAADAVVQWNNSREILTSSGAATGLAGGEIGRYSTSHYFSGLIYRMLIYNVPHTNAEMDAVVAALISDHSIFTDYTRQIICRGDSLTDGQGSTLLRSYPMQLWERRQNHKIFHQGVGGTKWTVLDTNDPNLLDPLFDGALASNRIAYMCGTNDINSDAIDGATCFGRATGVCADRKAAHAWEIWIGTIPDRGGVDTQITDYNALVRGGDASFDEIVDYGKNSPTETRLSDSTNGTYYGVDGLHLVNAGYGVMAEHTAELMEVEPTITDHPDSATKNEGESVTFSISATGTPAPTYQWRKDGENIPGATSASYEIEEVSADDAGDYDCVVTNSEGSDTSDAATLTVSASSSRILSTRLGLGLGLGLT